MIRQNWSYRINLLRGPLSMRHMWCQYFPNICHFLVQPPFPPPLSDTFSVCTYTFWQCVTYVTYQSKFPIVILRTNYQKCRERNKAHREKKRYQTICHAYIDSRWYNCCTRITHSFDQIEPFSAPIHNHFKRGTKATHIYMQLYNGIILMGEKNATKCGIPLSFQVMVCLECFRRTALFATLSDLCAFIFVCFSSSSVFTSSE